MAIQPGPHLFPELYLPHVGWLCHQAGDAVALYLNQGWFEYKEQAFAWLYLRNGDTVLDCGAHFGLYAALAGYAVGQGVVLAVEPNAGTIPVLERNMERHGTPRTCVIRKAVWSHTGDGRFYPVGEGHAAYSSLIPPQESGEATAVSTITLDDLLDEHGLAHVDFAKIDVEGAEIEALRGADRSIREERLPLVMIECTEENLKRAGASGRDLFQAAESAGYQVMQFDPESLRLLPRRYDGPVWYENLFLTRHAGMVNDRLATAAPERCRIAREILDRGAAANALYERTQESGQTVTAAQAGAEEAYRRLGEASWWIDETRRQLAGKQRELDEAHAEHEETRRHLSETQQQLAAARQETVEAERRAHEEQAQKAAARCLLEELAENLRPYLASRYIRLGWQIRLIHKPEWLMNFVGRGGKRE